VSDALVRQLLQSGDISIKVILAEDSEIVRRGIRQLLSAETETVAATAHDGHNSLAMLVR